MKNILNKFIELLLSLFPKSKSDAFENAILDAVFKNDITDIGAILAAGANTNLYISLHTADPGEAGSQTTNEVTTGAYTNYARQAVVRATGFTVTADNVVNANAITFPESSGGTGATVTHVGIGRDASAAGLLLYSAALSASKTINTGDTPNIAAGEIDVTEA